MKTYKIFKKIWKTWETCRVATLYIKWNLESHDSCLTGLRPKKFHFSQSQEIYQYQLKQTNVLKQMNKSLIWLHKLQP